VVVVFWFWMGSTLRCAPFLHIYHKGNKNLGVMLLNDQQFSQFLSELQAYLKQPKVFVTDINRAREFYNAVDLAKQLFPNAKIEIRDDPLQTGAMSLHMEHIDMVVRGEREINLFIQLIELADNFEVYPINDEEICFAAVFQGVNKRV
jgi:hypothetical protein